MRSPHSSRKIVVKVGSSLLTGGKTLIVVENLRRIVGHVAGLVKEGHQVILVTSGAIASGLSVLGLSTKPKDLATLQAAAAAGQNILMQAYSAAFARHDLKCGQILITKEDFNDRRRYQNARHTVDALLKFGIIPVFNENDAVSVDEIKFGDNDTLSAHVAVAVGASGLLILTDIDGLYRDFDMTNGRRDGLIKEVSKVTPAIERSACGTDKDGCVGGMSTKIKAARIATDAGIAMILANGSRDHLKVSFDALSYVDYDGTRFKAR